MSAFDPHVPRPAPERELLRAGDLAAFARDPRLARRHVLGLGALGLGALALSSIARGNARSNAPRPGDARPARFPAKAKRVVYLFQAGGPSQFETFDPKPLLREKHGEPLPDSVRQGQRLTGMSANQALLPLAGSFTDFRRHGESGLWVSDLLPHTAGLADRLCVVRSLHTEAINHDPAITYFCTGHQQPGRPSMGAWLSYGLGSDNANLPAFVVLVSKDANRDQPLYSRLWGPGFLPSEHQGVQFRSGAEAVLYLANPDGVSRDARRSMLDALKALEAEQRTHALDPEIDARLAQAELAFRMQTSVPEATSTKGEPDATFTLYGESARTPGTYAANCLLARRLLERGVRFVQLFHQGWDQHGNLPAGITAQCKATDQASAALVTDLARRGLLDDTLVVWGGEFGRTAYCQGKMTPGDYGRDHHPRCFPVWLAGAGVKAGHVHGTTDEFGYNVVDGAVHVHDLHATLLHLLGIDHEQLVYPFQGRYFRLTDVAGEVVRELLA
ncbi:MAG: DUF1501 domain-containing protein [Planctomycetes bacterium]|nr:DUF1501 domain-containing protein [Planctomycetota bacterium]